tara:strand:+ start:927 stop:1178 length:252 start_codon:yes stop_codon:yes gene_type:complete
MKTAFRITKDEFNLIYRTLNIAYEAGKFETYDKECVEYLLKDIEENIIECGTTRKNWQVVEYNDPSFASCVNRQQYDHYGEFE